jgi:hypothetical protein
LSPMPVSRGLPPPPSLPRAHPWAATKRPQPHKLQTSPPPMNNTRGTCAAQKPSSLEAVERHARVHVLAAPPPPPAPAPAPPAPAAAAAPHKGRVPVLDLQRARAVAWVRRWQVLGRLHCSPGGQHASPVRLPTAGEGASSSNGGISF